MVNLGTLAFALATFSFVVVFHSITFGFGRYFVRDSPGVPVISLIEVEPKLSLLGPLFDRLILDRGLGADKTLPLHHVIVDVLLVVGPVDQVEVLAPGLALAAPGGGALQGLMRTVEAADPELGKLSLEVARDLDDDADVERARGVLVAALLVVVLPAIQLGVDLLVHVTEARVVSGNWSAGAIGLFRSDEDCVANLVIDSTLQDN